MIMQSSVYPRLRLRPRPRGDLDLDLPGVGDLGLPLGLGLAGLDRGRVIGRGRDGEPVRVGLTLLRERPRCRASLVHSESKSSSPMKNSTKTVFTFMIAR